MKKIKPATRTQAKRLLQEIYIDNIIRFLEEKYRNAPINISNLPEENLTNRWLDNNQVQEIVNTMNIKLCKFFENEFKHNEEGMNNFIMALTDEAKQEKQKELNENIKPVVKSENIVILENIDKNEGKVTSDQNQIKEVKDPVDKPRRSSNGIQNPSSEKFRKGQQRQTSLNAKNTTDNNGIKNINDAKILLDHHQSHNQNHHYYHDEDALITVSNKKANKSMMQQNSLISQQKTKYRRGQNVVTITENLQHCSQKVNTIESFIATWKTEIDQKGSDELDQTGYTISDFERATRRREHIEEILSEIANQTIVDGSYFDVIKSEIWEIAEDYERVLSDQSLQFKKDMNNLKQSTENKIAFLEKENKELNDRIKRLSNSIELEQKYEETTIQLIETERSFNVLDQKYHTLVNQMDKLKKIFQYIEINFVNLKRMILDIKVNRWPTVTDPLRLELYQKNALKCYDYIERLYWDDTICALIDMKLDKQTHPANPPTLDLIDHALKNLELSKVALTKMEKLSAIKPKELKEVETQAYEYEFNLIYERELIHYKDILRKTYDIATKGNTKDQAFYSLQKIDDIQKYSMIVSNHKLSTSMNHLKIYNLQYPISIGKLALAMIQSYEIWINKQNQDASPNDNTIQVNKQIHSNNNNGGIGSTENPYTNNNYSNERGSLNPKSLLIAGIMRVISSIWLKKENNTEFSGIQKHYLSKYSGINDEYLTRLSSREQTDTNSKEELRSGHNNRRLGFNMDSESNLTKETSFFTTQNANREGILPLECDTPIEREMNPLLTRIDEKNEDNSPGDIGSQKAKARLFMDKFAQTDTQKYPNVLDDMSTKYHQYIKNLPSEELNNVDITSSSIEEHIANGDQRTSPFLIKNDFMLAPINRHNRQYKDRNAKLNRTFNEGMNKSKFPKLERLQMIQKIQKEYQYLEECTDNNNSILQGLYDGETKYDKIGQKTLEDIIYEQTKKTIIALNEYLDMSNNNSPQTSKSPTSKNKSDIEETAKAVQELLKQKLLENKYDELLEYIRKVDKTPLHSETVAMTSRLIAQGKSDILKKKIRSGSEWGKKHIATPNSANAMRYKIIDETNHHNNHYNNNNNNNNNRIRTPIRQEFYDRISPQSKQSIPFRHFTNFFNAKKANLQSRISPFNGHDINLNNVTRYENGYGNLNSTSRRKKSDLQSIVNLNLYDIKLPLDQLHQRQPTNKDSPSSKDQDILDTVTYNDNRTGFKMQDTLIKSIESDRIDTQYNEKFKKRDSTSREYRGNNLLRQNIISPGRHRIENIRQEKKFVFKDLPNRGHQKRRLSPNVY